MLRTLTILLTLALLITIYSQTVLAASPTDGPFLATWERTDRPVLDGIAARTWMWGPEANQPIMTEAYTEAPGGQRQVQYFDKARMEITNPNGDAGSIWYVTNGLLVVELITGNMQTGNNDFQQRRSALVNVAGDADGLTGPTYATFESLLDEAPASVGSTIMERIDRNGNVTNDPLLGAQSVTIGKVDEITNHAIAAPFWTFMNSSGMVYRSGQFMSEQLFEDPYFATGRPITEAYWANVKLGGEQRDVLVQCFERRCLTYTPGNPAGFIVEAGNVGQHYYEWRYGDDEETTETPLVDPAPPADPTPPATPTPPASPTPPVEPTPPANPGLAPPSYETPPLPTPDTATEYAFSHKFGLPSLRVELDAPHKVAVAPSGDVYVTNTRRNQVLRFNAEGLLLTKWGSKGTGNGQFNAPVGVAVDSDGFVYVADFGNHRVQKFQANGAFVESWGGIGAAQGSFDGPWDIAIAPDDTVYVTELTNSRIQSFRADGKPLRVIGGPGTLDGQFLTPQGVDVAVDGRVFVADSGNNRIQVFDADGEWLGTSSPDNVELSIPTDVAIASDKAIYVSEISDRVRILTPIEQAPGEGRIFIRFPWESTGTLGQSFSDPNGLVVRPDGHIFVADTGNGRIHHFGSPDYDDVYPALLDTWSNASRGRFSTNAPTAMAMGPNENLYIIDRGEEEIKVVSKSGEHRLLIDFQITDTLLLDEPMAIAIGRDGNLYVPDNVLHLVVKLDANGNYLGHFGESGSGDGQFTNPKAIAVDEDGNIYVGDDNGIQKFGPDFGFVSSWDEARKPTALATFEGILFATVAGADDLVYQFDLDGDYLFGWGIGFDDPSGVAIDGDGFVYVSDTNRIIQKFQVLDTTVASVAQWGRIGSADGEFSADMYPGTEIVVDETGNVYVTDPGNDRVQIFAPVD